MYLQLIRLDIEPNFLFKLNIMKKIFLVLVVLAAVLNVYSQKSIDALFEKYAGKDGFTTVTINGSLLKFAGCQHENDKGSLPPSVTEIRILAQEGENPSVGNFYDLVIKDIDLKLYEEVMRVKESDQDMRMLVRTEGDRFKEFLLIAGGDDNALIQIIGNMSFEDVEKIKADAEDGDGVSF